MYIPTLTVWVIMYVSCLQAPGEPPANVTIVSVSSHGVSVEWCDTPKPNGAITGYIAVIQVSRADGRTDGRTDGH